MVTIIFKNGFSIEAEQNGTCYIVDEKPTFPEDLSEITITDDETTTVINNARLIEPYAIDDRYWFSFIEIPEQELINERVQAEIAKITPYTDTKKAYIGDTEVTFTDVPSGNITVYFPFEYSMERVSDRVTITFAELDEVTDITISVL